MPRALWKGAISFGLVHIPVALYPAAREHRIDFDWLDKRNMKPVGYKRVNKATGKEVPKENIVRGVEVEEGQYVVLDDDEIKAALPLREALKKSGRIGIAQVVIQTKQHLAALMPKGDALVLDTLRWSDELRPFDELDLPEKGKKTAPSARELQMAEQLIADMCTDWSPEQYEDHFRDAIMKLVEAKRKKGDVRDVAPIEAPATESAGAEVIDLTELLKRSLQVKSGKAKRAAAASTRRTAK